MKLGVRRPALAVFLVLLAGCAPKESGLSSCDYQSEPVSRLPGYNLSRHDPLDFSASQRVGAYTRSPVMHERHQGFLRNLREAQELDRAAQKLGREPGSLFRR